MNQKLDTALANTLEDPLKLLHLTAIFLDMAASSNKEEITDYQQKLMDVFAEHLDNHPMVTALDALVKGVTGFYLTNFAQATKDLLSALDKFKPGMPKDILGAIHFALGANYRSMGEIDLAVEHQFEAAELINPQGLFSITYAYTYYQLGEIHISIGEYKSAETYFQNALSVVSTTADNTANFRINNALGNCYFHLGDYKNSMQYLSMALSLPNLTAAEKARGLCDLGIANYGHEIYDKAEDYLNESLAIRRSNNLEDATSTSMLNLGKVLLKQKKYQEAVTILSEALAITEKYNALSKKIKIYKSLAKAYELLGNNEDALKYFKLYDAFNNEIRTEQEHKIFRLKNKQIESQKLQVQEKNIQLKDTLDELAKVKNSRKSLFFSIGTAIVLVILTEAFFDPVIESYAHSVYLSLGVKILIALMLKPMESFYERILFRRAMKLK
jgi:tetratricopeptide (TPR) repeat protein